MLEGYTEAEQMDLRRERDDKKKRGRIFFFFLPAFNCQRVHTTVCSVCCQGALLCQKRIWNLISGVLFSGQDWSACVSCMLTWHATGGLFVSVKTVIIWASDFMGALGLTGSIGPDSYWANLNSVLNKFHRSGAILGSIVTQLKFIQKIIISLCHQKR